MLQTRSIVVSMVASTREICACPHKSQYIRISLSGPGQSSITRYSAGPTRVGLQRVNKGGAQPEKF